MFKVLLIDDESFILEGLKVLIDWESEGFEIVSTASNGQEALEFLNNNKVDLIVSDIKMPVMTGLELLAKIRENNISEAYFVILSGYADFSYAKEAIRYDSTDYILKPVNKNELIQTLRKITQMKVTQEEREAKTTEMKQAYLARNLISLIRGKFDDQNLKCIKENMKLTKAIRYIEITLDYSDIEEEYIDYDKRKRQRKLYKVCKDLLKDDKDHCVFDVSAEENVYDVGILYCEYMAKDKEMDESEYLSLLADEIQNSIEVPIVMFVGKKVEDISNITKSYNSVNVLRTFQGFRKEKRVYYYEDEVQVSSGNVVIYKKSLDKLISAVEHNNNAEITKSVNGFYKEMKEMGATEEIMMLNINYVLFQLIHLATKQDNEINQSEIMRIIGQTSHKKGIKRGSKEHLTRLTYEYAEYLAQLRSKSSKGVLDNVLKEIEDNYDQNLTLKDLGEKYYINSAYLGQIFRKKFGKSFNDYLAKYRMEKAASLLVNTNKKIITIAEKVGYQDVDYFVNRFVLAKGCTPTKYRKRANVAV